MNKKLTIFIIISLLIHLAVIVFVKINKVPVKKQKPLYVDIIKKKKPVTKKEIKKKPDILSEKEKIFKKKGKIEKKQGEIVTKKESIPLKPQKKKESKKNIPKQSERKKTVQKGITTKELKKENNKKTVINKKIKEKKVEEKSEQTKKNEVISDDKIARILNPQDIISKYASPSEKGSKEGEDDVDVSMMKFKYASYFKKFERRLYQVWHYPKSSAMNGEEGTVKVKFTILKDGTITNIRVVRSSGYPALDKEAVKALKTMKGVPLPESYGLKRLNVTGYFSYKLNYMFVY